jgi:putative ABC transport system substrate-binding protein
MTITIGRRKFIAALGAAAGAWPLAARAQQPAMPVVGCLNLGSAQPRAHLMEAVRQGLKEIGFVDGRNLTIQYRWADDHSDRLPALAADLVNQRVAVLVAGADAAALAAKAATATIPIVFSIGSDPVAIGLVPSLNRPGGNVTGVTFFASQLEAKRLGVLHDVVPAAAVIAVLVNPTTPTASAVTRDLQEAARVLGLELQVLNASSEGDFDTAFATIAQRRPDALLVTASAFFNDRRDRLVSLAAQHSVPAMYELRDFAALGGLVSYGTSITGAYRQAGVYAGRILKGEKPADLPVMQSTKFELVINLKTAKTLNLTIPPGVLAIADEVIE